MLSGKIHTARLTGCEPDYEGSLEIDCDLLDAAGILVFEKILVSNRTNGERLETYAIPGPAGGRRFCLNGPAALKAKAGDVVTIMSFSVCSREEAERSNPKIIILNQENVIIQRKGGA